MQDKNKTNLIKQSFCPRKAQHAANEAQVNIKSKYRWPIFVQGVQKLIDYSQHLHKYII